MTYFSVWPHTYLTQIIAEYQPPPIILSTNDMLMDGLRRFYHHLSLSSRYFVKHTKNKLDPTITYSQKYLCILYKFLQAIDSASVQVWRISLRFVGSKQLVRLYYKQFSSVFSTLIGRGPTILDSHWSRASECCYPSNLMP